MSYDYTEALAELNNRTTLAELIDLVKNTAARVENATANVTSLLYSGTIKGENSWGKKGDRRGKRGTDHVFCYSRSSLVVQ